MGLIAESGSFGWPEGVALTLALASAIFAGRADRRAGRAEDRALDAEQRERKRYEADMERHERERVEAENARRARLHLEPIPCGR